MQKLADISMFESLDNSGSSSTAFFNAFVNNVEEQNYGTDTAVEDDIMYTDDGRVVTEVGTGEPVRITPELKAARSGNIEAIMDECLNAAHKLDLALNTYERFAHEVLASAPKMQNPACAYILTNWVSLQYEKESDKMLALKRDFDYGIQKLLQKPTQQEIAQAEEDYPYISFYI